jgi:hypothetical protein
MHIHRLPIEHHQGKAAATALILDNLNAHFAGKPLPSPVSIKA